MRGDLLIVRCFGGVFRVVRFWSESPNAIFITSDEGLERLQRDDSTIFPIGFPKEDVFKYNPKLAKTINNIGGTDKLDWRKLTPLKTRTIIS